MSKWSLTRKIATVGCILAAISLSVFIILASDRTEDSSDTTAMPFVNAAVISPKTYGSYGELMFAYVGQGNRLYNLDNESNPVINQPVRELLYASDDSILYTVACELDHSHLGRESVIQELQIGEQENRLNTIAIVTIDPCWSSNDEVIYYTEDSSPNQLCTFEPLTSTTEVAATFDRDIKGLRISSDGLLVTLSDGSEMLYVPLSKQLADPGIPTKGNTITVCEQYDLFLTPEGTLSYHWQGSGELVTIAENVPVNFTDISASMKQYDAGLPQTTVKKIIMRPDIEIDLLYRIRLNGRNYNVVNVDTAKYVNLLEVQVSEDNR